MTKPKPTPKRVTIDFATDEWSNERAFTATVTGPWAKYPLGFGKSSDTECAAAEVDFATNAAEFAEVRKRFAKEIGAKFEILEDAEHQLAALKKTTALCADNDCAYCC